MLYLATEANSVGGQAIDLANKALHLRLNKGPMPPELAQAVLDYKSGKQDDTDLAFFLASETGLRKDIVRLSLPYMKVPARAEIFDLLEVPEFEGDSLPSIEERIRVVKEMRTRYHTGLNVTYTAIKRALYKRGTSDLPDSFIASILNGTENGLIKAGKLDEAEKLAMTRVGLSADEASRVVACGKAMIKKYEEHTGPSEDEGPAPERPGRRKSAPTP